MRMLDLLLKIVGVLIFLPMELIARSVKLELSGQEHVPKGGYILCPTHMGELDPYFVRLALGERVCAKGRSRFIFRLEAGPLVRRLFLAHWGGWIVEESGPNLKALRGAMAWLAAGRPVVVFPEGHDHGQGLLHLGAAFLACQANRPLLPLVIDRGVFVKVGTPFYIFPFLVFRRYRREAPRVRLAFLEPLWPDLERYRREGRRYLEELTKELGRRLFGQEVRVAPPRAAGLA
ncbi:MAG: lysophospholipid acyltransferase family protein [Candidatus Bipolaricaulia bacterium]